MISAFCLLSMEYLAYRQRRPIFQMAEIRILTGFGGLDWFLDHFGLDNGLLPSDGLIDRVFVALSQVENGPELSSFGLSVPRWSHFQKCNFIIFIIK